jgi:serine/threonine-protein kinase
MAHYLVQKAGPVATSPEELGLVLARFVPGDEAQAAFRAACGIGAASSGGSGRTTGAGDDEPEGAALAARDPARPTPGWATPASTPWEPALLEQARAALAHHVGPMARILVDRAAARARSGSELYALLAAEIPSPRDRTAFLRAAPPSDSKG